MLIENYGNDVYRKNIILETQDEAYKRRLIEETQQAYKRLTEEELMTDWQYSDVMRVLHGTREDKFEEFE